MNKKGFTLIELLVVIAIIGILSSIAIIYLSDARNKANDSKVQSNITTAITQFEVDKANGTTFADQAAITTAVTAINTKLGGFPCGDATASTTRSSAVDADANITKIAFTHALCTTPSVSFCADSDGYRGTSTGSTLGVCNH